MDQQNYEYLKSHCKVKEGDWVDDRIAVVAIARVLLEEGMLEEVWQTIEFFEDPRKYWAEITSLIQNYEGENDIEVEEEGI